MVDEKEFNIPIVSDKIHFWMIRSKGGIFYTDFILNRYVAVGWNYINKDTDLKNEKLKEILPEKQKFVNPRSATRAINKSKMFINDINVNDIVLLPNKGMSKITIALLGEYYEDNSKTIDDENIFMNNIETGKVYEEIPKCPYIKRRKIYVLRTVEANEINYHLYNTLRNYNGIDDIDEYAEEILGLIYDIYLYNGKVHIPLEVKQENDIDLFGMSALFYGTTQYFAPYNAKLTTKVNVCSKGQIDIVIQNGLELLNTFGPYIYNGFMLMLTGKTIVPQLPSIIKEFVSIPYEMNKQKIEIEKMKNEVELQKIEIEERRMSLKKKNDNNQGLTDSDDNKIIEISSIIAKSNDALDINTDKLQSKAKELLRRRIEKNPEQNTTEK